MTNAIHVSEEVAVKRNIDGCVLAGLRRLSTHNFTPTDKWPNPNILLRRVSLPYIVPLRCDFCGQVKAEYQVNVTVWCGECPAYDDYKWWLT